MLLIEDFESGVDLINDHYGTSHTSATFFRLCPCDEYFPLITEIISTDERSVISIWLSHRDVHAENGEIRNNQDK